MLADADTRGAGYAKRPTNNTTFTLKDRSPGRCSKPLMVNSGPECNPVDSRFETEYGLDRAGFHDGSEH